MKRLFDVVVSAAGLTVLSPLLAAIAIVLRVKHGSPVFFRQARVGQYGRTFGIHKFRTMDQSPGPLVTAGVDPRIHRTGRLLRSTKLDELPQLWDVLRGRMSVVGPRPEVPEFVEHWPAAQRDVILSVRPGITDPASVAFRHEEQILAGYGDPRTAYVGVILPEKCRLYVAYVQDPSRAKDLRVMRDTVRALFRKAGDS